MNDYETIRVEKRLIPEGGKLVEAYSFKGEIIVCQTDQDLGEEHSCDAMGCTSCSHVVHRLPADAAEQIEKLRELVSLAADQFAADAKRLLPGAHGHKLQELADKYRDYLNV